MARIRTIKPEFFFDEDLAKLSAHTRLFFIGLWTHADRAGRGEDRPGKLKALIFPYEEVDAEAMMAALSPHFVVRYEAKGKKYFQIVSFSKHQYPNIKEPKSLIPPSRNEHHASTVPAPYSHHPDMLDKGKGMDNGKGREGNGVQRAARASACGKLSTIVDKSIPPKIELVQAYCAERGNKVDAQLWFDHYSANGWKVGRNPMKDWRAAIRTWERNGYKSQAKIVGQAAPTGRDYDAKTIRGS